MLAHDNGVAFVLARDSADAWPDSSRAHHPLYLNGNCRRQREASAVYAAYGVQHLVPERDVRITLLEGGPRILGPLTERVANKAQTADGARRACRHRMPCYQHHTRTGDGH